MKENKDYIIFILGYDLLQDYFLDSKETECDLIYEKCSKIADDFLSSEYNSNNKNLYDCIADYIKSKRYINFLNSLEEKQIKTLEEWQKSTEEVFDDFCKVGEMVDQSIIDYFINLLPPICLKENYVQAGGVYVHTVDKDNNSFKPTYTTFEKEDENWIYRGNCFKGKNIDMTHVASKAKNNEINQMGYIENSIVDRFNEMKEKFNWKLNLNENAFSRILDKIKADDEIAIILDETIGNAIVQVKDEILKCEEKEVSENNKYDALKKRQREEFNTFPIHFAFGDKQMKQELAELNVKEEEIDKKLVGIGAGGFILKEDYPKFEEMTDRHYEEIQNEIKNDKDGTGFIKDMFFSELNNHEYGYTNDVEDTLITLGITAIDLIRNKKLQNGLELAKKKFIENEEEISELE